MAYTDDAVRAKLNSLNETQDAIVSVAQWIMFHKKYAERTAQLWDQKLRDVAAAKRLNLIYLANEIIQQSKLRKRVEFVAAFQPIIADSTSTAYKGASSDVQSKIRRVVTVWRERQIFDPACQQDIEARINELDRQRGGARKGGLGGSLFASSASSAPPEYQNLITTQSSLTKSEVISKPAISGANLEWDRFNDPSVPEATPPVQAARLGALLKTLANAEGAVAETLKARKSLVEGLEKILAKNKEELELEEEQLRTVNARKGEIEGKKRDVEDSIMAGLAQVGNGAMAARGTTPDQEPPRPDAEPLTPPPVESITPIGTPQPDLTTATDPAVVAELPPTQNEAASPARALPQTAILPGVGNGHPRDASPENGSSVQDPRLAKRRKIGAPAVETDEFAAFANEGTGLDADVEAMLGSA